jgi:predicted Ser/Thr protein kinase
MSCDIVTENGQACSHAALTLKLVNGQYDLVNCKSYCRLHTEMIIKDFTTEFVSVAVGSLDANISDIFVAINGEDITNFPPEIVSQMILTIPDLDVAISVSLDRNAGEGQVSKWLTSDGIVRDRWISSRWRKSLDEKGNTILTINFKINLVDEEALGRCPVLPGDLLNRTSNLLESSVNTENWKLDDFQTVNFIGKGAYGDVYMVKEKKNGFVCVLKYIDKSKVKNRSSLLREIEIHKGLCHPNIVKMFGYFEDFNRIYILMEYVNGPDLQILCVRHLKHVPPIGDVRKIIIQAAKGLEYLQRNKVVHRDIKPANLLVKDNYEIKITDFGLSVYGTSSILSGTPNYISPEVLRKDPASYPSDIWSLGCVMYYLLVGSCPFQDPTMSVSETYKNILACRYDLSKVREDNAADLIKKIFVLNPEARITIMEMLVHPFFE